MKQNECILCNSKNSSHLLTKNNFNLYICKNCNLVYVYPQPSLDKLIKDYYSEKSGYHSRFKKNNGRFVEILDKLYRFKIKSSLLDVGCSTGEFLSMAKKRGFYEYGVEVNERTVKIANNNGLNVFNGTLEDANLKNNYFLVIHLGDIIEHVLNPVALLKECKRILKKEGIIIISTPNLDCFWVRATHLLYKWFNFPWSVMIPPYHLFLFSQSNFKKLLSRMKFKTLDIKYHRCSLRHELGSTGLFKKLKQEKSINILFYTLLVFSIYIFIYLIDFLITPFKNKDFEMTIFVQNKTSICD